MLTQWFHYVWWILQTFCLQDGRKASSSLRCECWCRHQVWVQSLPDQRHSNQQQGNLPVSHTVWRQWELSVHAVCLLVWVQRLPWQSTLLCQWRPLALCELSRVSTQRCALFAWPKHWPSRGTSHLLHTKLLTMAAAANHQCSLWMGLHWHRMTPDQRASILRGLRFQESSGCLVDSCQSCLAVVRQTTIEETFEACARSTLPKNYGLLQMTELTGQDPSLTRLRLAAVRHNPSPSHRLVAFSWTGHQVDSTTEISSSYFSFCASLSS